LSGHVRNIDATVLTTPKCRCAFCNEYPGQPATRALASGSDRAARNKSYHYSWVYGCRESKRFMQRYSLSMTVFEIEGGTGRRKHEATSSRHSITPRRHLEPRPNPELLLVEVNKGILFCCCSVSSCQAHSQHASTSIILYIAA
jgi:hypothetical protein